MALWLKIFIICCRSRRSQHCRLLATTPMKLLGVAPPPAALLPTTTAGGRTVVSAALLLSNAVNDDDAVVSNMLECERRVSWLVHETRGKESKRHLK